jgi:hypothetical protein
VPSRSASSRLVPGIKLKGSLRGKSLGVKATDAQAAIHLAHACRFPYRGLDLRPIVYRLLDALLVPIGGHGLVPSGLGRRTRRAVDAAVNTVPALGNLAAEIARAVGAGILKLGKAEIHLGHVGFQCRRLIGPPGKNWGGPGNDAIRVEPRRSSSPNVGMRGAGLKLLGFKDPATEMPMPPERSYSAQAALCC